MSSIVTGSGIDPSYTIDRDKHLLQLEAISKGHTGTKCFVISQLVHELYNKKPYPHGFICLVDIGGYITLDIIIIYDFQLFIVNRRNHIRLTSESEGLHEHNIL